MMTDEIKKRIELIKNGKTPKGYSKDVVFIPLEWKFKELNKIARRIKEKAGNKELETLSISAGIGFVNQASKFGKELSGAQYVNYTVLNKGDFSYNKGNSKMYPQGCVYMLKDRDIAAVPNVFNSFRLNEKICNSSYYANLFTNGYLNKQLYKFINSGVRNDGLLNLYDDDFYSCLLPVPPLTEQEKIAEILNCCDKVIGLRNQLIAEEQIRKKWLMKKLLKRHKHWKKTTIGDLTIVCAGATPSTKMSEYWGGNIRWMNSGELNLKQVYEVKGRITESGLQNSGTKLLPTNCVLVGLAGQGKTRGTVAINHVPLCTNQSIAAILPKDEFNTEYLFWDLENRYAELRKISSGDGARGGLNLELINGLIVYLPPIEKQEEIANILSATEHKIELLKLELEQWQLKKKSLMQLLLTGIVRVKL